MNGGERVVATSDGFEFDVVERLDAHADAVYAHTVPERGDFGRDVLGVDFDGKFLAVVERQRRNERCKLTLRQD